MMCVMPPEPLPCDVLPCPGGDVIIIPRGLLGIRLTPAQQRVLGKQLPALAELVGIAAA